MKVVLVGMGSETITLESLSAFLKAHGHDVVLVYDEALFDDKNYLTIHWLGRLLNKPANTAARIAALNPNVVGFTVFTSCYQWALEVAREVRKRSKATIVFGGIHPTCLPEVVIREDCVDAVCVGEGEEALLELVESIETGDGRKDIPNIWFKTPDGGITRNPERKPREDIDSYPIPDKSLFENAVPIPYYYLAVTSRGCPYGCKFCALSFMGKQARELGVNPLRERSVDNVIYELKTMRARYRYEWIDIKNNTFSANRKWTLEFLKRYKEEIGLPLRVFGHPLKIDFEIAKALKEAGCWRVQMGIESFSEKVRKEVLGRHESNDDIRRACRAMDDAGLSYSLDLILGLPGQTEEEYRETAEFFASCRCLARVTPFWIGYLPGTPLIEDAARMGILDAEAIRRIEQGLDEHYVVQGSVHDPAEIRRLKGWHLFFRMVPTTPKSLVRYILDRRLYRWFSYIPAGPIIFVMDFLASYAIKDLSATTYIKTYLWFFRKRLKERQEDS